MLPLDSYQEAFLVSDVVFIERTSPFFSATRQLSGVTDIATSQDAGPAGSQYVEIEEKRCAVSGAPGLVCPERPVTPWRFTHKSSRRPPGCMWPPARSSTPSPLTVHWFNGVSHDPCRRRRSPGCA